MHNWGLSHDRHPQHAREREVNIMSFQTKETRKARRRHLCECCYRIVNAGERYVKVAGQNEGDFYSAKTCLACDSLIQLVWETAGPYDYPDGLAFDEFYQAAEDLDLACRIPQENRRVAA
ncbi:TPA: hypothetical protein NH927_006364 [Pseudomonas aeruginosa]|nr:hypothetical protein [Pseudomonas aeruginosa]